MTEEGHSPAHKKPGPCRAAANLAVAPAKVRSNASTIRAFFLHGKSVAIGVRAAGNPQPPPQANVARTEANRTAAAEPLADPAEGGWPAPVGGLRRDVRGHSAFTTRGHGDAQPLLGMPAGAQGQEPQVSMTRIYH